MRERGGPVRSWAGITWDVSRAVRRGAGLGGGWTLGKRHGARPGGVGALYVLLTVVE